MLPNKRPSLEGRAGCPFHPYPNLSDWSIRAASSSCLLERKRKEPKKISQVEQKNLWYRSNSWKIRGKPQNKELVLPAAIDRERGSRGASGSERAMPMRVHCSGRRLRFGPFGRLAGRKGREEFPIKNNKRKEGRIYKHASHLVFF
jgi:hypothetical protein